MSSQIKKTSPQLLVLLLLSLATPLALGGCESAREAPDGEVQLEDKDRAEMKDFGITAKVRTGLAKDERVSAFDVDVETREGVVILHGAVDREGDRSTAEKIARATEGVSGVVNRITVGHGESSAT